MLSNDIFEKRPGIDKQSTVIRRAIAYGMNAASGHNLQSWKVKLISDNAMLLYVDEKRCLPATDPIGRVLHLSQGTFIETLSIGASAMGYKTAVDYFPEGEYSYQELGKKPVAHIVLEQDDSISADPLFDFIYKRQTNRKVYEGPMITDNEITDINRFAENDRVEIVTFNDPSEIQPVLEILYQAWEIEVNTYRAYEESREKLRYSKQERSKKRDGLSIGAMGEERLTGFIAEKFLNHGNKKRWHSNFAKANLLTGQKKRLNSAKGLVFLKSKTNSCLDWVITGTVLARWDLAVTRLGLYSHIYSQVVQDYPEMQQLQKTLNRLLNVREKEKVQLVMRIGRAKKPYYSYRRHVEDLLVKDSGGAG